MKAIKKQRLESELEAEHEPATTDLATFINYVNKLHPTITPEAMTSLLESNLFTIDRMSQMIHSLDDLILAAKTFPAFSNRLTEFALSDHNRFETLMAGIHHFTLVAELQNHLPPLAPLAIEYLLADMQRFKKVYPFAALFALGGATKTLQTYQKTILENILSEKHANFYVNDSIINYQYLCEAFPDYSPQIIEHLLQNKSLCERTLNTPAERLRAATYFPTHAEQFFNIEEALSKPNMLARAISNHHNNLLFMKEVFPLYFTQIINAVYSIANFTHANRLIKNTPDELNEFKNKDAITALVFIEYLNYPTRRDQAFGYFGNEILELTNKYFELISPDLEYQIASTTLANRLNSAGVSDKKIQERLNNFIRRLHHLYTTNELEYRSRYDSTSGFVKKHALTIIELSEIFGEDAIRLLQSKIGSTVLPLRRYLNNIHPVNLNLKVKFIEILKKNNFKRSVAEVDHLSLLLNSINTCDKTTIDDIISATEKASFTTTRDLIHFIYEACLAALVKQLGLKIDEVEIEKLQSKLPIDRFIDLRKGFESLKGEYTNLFMDILRADFSKHANFNHFVNSIENNNELGKAIALHNNRCTEELRQGGIDTELAHYYPITETFTYVKGIDVLAICKEIVNLIDELQALLCANNNILTKQFKKFKNEFLKGNKFDHIPDKLYMRITKESLRNLINTILRTTERLTQANDLFDSTTIENSKTISNTIHDRIRQLSSAAAKNSKTTTFSIKQWDKNDINTLLLGNDLSCCLATDGGYFQEMLMRRIDKSCFMHVVINETTGEPICGNWLFFGKVAGASNQPSPDEIYVVANYFELRTNYRDNAELRDLIVQSLVNFTKQFTINIKAKNFYIRPLSYGGIPDFNLEAVQVKLDKVGGFFNLETRTTQSTCTQYLYAMEIDEFYRTLDSQPVLTNTSVGQPSTVGIFASTQRLVVGANGNPSFSAVGDSPRININ